MARPLIREPDLPNRWLGGTGDESAACISCNKCALYMFKQPLRCYVEDPLEDS